MGLQKVLHVFICKCQSSNFCCLFPPRQGYRLGHGEVVDGMMKDGLWDVYNDYGMGVCAELCADQHGISREEQVLHLQETF